MRNKLTYDHFASEDGGNYETHSEENADEDAAEPVICNGDQRMVSDFSFGCFRSNLFEQFDILNCSGV